MPNKPAFALLARPRLAVVSGALRLAPGGGRGLNAGAVAQVTAEAGR